MHSTCSGLHTQAHAHIHVYVCTHTCASRYIPTICFRKEEEDNKYCLSLCPECHWCVFPKCQFSLVNWLIYFILVNSSLHPSKRGDFIFIKFQAGRKPGSKKGEGRESGTGAWLPLRAATQVHLLRALRTCLGFYPAIVHFSTAFAHCGASGEFQQLEYT